MNRLFDYLENYGILLCNSNPYLPSLDDIGCGWKEVTELIDNQLMFYSKSFKRRTAYLSREVYLLFNIVKIKKPLTIQAEYIYELLKRNPSADTKFLKTVATPILSKKSYEDAFNFLLQERYITAVQNGTRLNENWSSFLYGTEKQWEILSQGLEDIRRTINKDKAVERLWEVVGEKMGTKDFAAFAGLTC